MFLIFSDVLVLASGEKAVDFLALVPRPKPSHGLADGLRFCRAKAKFYPGKSHGSGSEAKSRPNPTSDLGKPSQNITNFTFPAPALRLFLSRII
jgi:hypothetical protein